jgi:hypothetical protein
LPLAPQKKGKAVVAITLDPSAFTSLNDDTPTRCRIALSASATAPGNVDPSTSNNEVTVEIDVFDLGDAPVVTAHESFVTTLKRVKVKLKDGEASRSKVIRIRAGNGDVVPADEVPGHSVTGVAVDGDCPAGTVVSLDMDRSTAGMQSSALVVGGDTADGKLLLSIAAADFPSPGKTAPARCTAEVSVSGPGGDVDASNDLALVVIEVLDANDY